MTKIIGIVQVKGGAGRSTVATNLAVTLSKTASVALIDCDMPQGTSMSWFSLREADNQSEKLSLSTAETHQELIELITELNDNFDYIIIDAPPRIAEVTRAILMLSSLLLVPLGASAPEIWATTDLLNTIEEAKQKRPELDYRIVWNRYRSYTRSAKELSEAVSQELEAPELKTRLGYRVAYSEALSQGMGVSEWSDKTAKQELIDLSKEIEDLLI